MGGKCNYHCGHRNIFFIMNSSFLNISSQRGPLCPILLHLLILRLSYWQAKYDEMHLSIKSAVPTTIGVAKRQSTLNLLYHRAKSRIFCWRNGCYSKRPAREPAIRRRCATSGSLVAESGCLSDKVWLVALNFCNGTSTNFSHFQKQYHTFISNPTRPESNHSWLKFHKTHGKISRTINTPANSVGWVWQTIRLI